ncbi:hypothetical protein [Mesorhizobium sp.]|uniref:hypothetical protein n=1 Tax=Mesorhizobium sp. TaxID=1871066 RepID=UPI0025FADF14|nr:hypothetical protein [Mesorhizobium sp.]
MSGMYQRIEVITGIARRRHWSTEAKLRIKAAAASRALVNRELARMGSSLSIATECIG